MLPATVGREIEAVRFSVVGALWLLWLLGYNLSVAVWEGGPHTTIVRAFLRAPDGHLIELGQTDD